MVSGYLSAFSREVRRRACGKHVRPTPTCFQAGFRLSPSSQHGAFPAPCQGIDHPVLPVQGRHAATHPAPQELGGIATEAPVSAVRARRGRRGGSFRRWRRRPPLFGHVRRPGQPKRGSGPARRNRRSEVQQCDERRLPPTVRWWGSRATPALSSRRGSGPSAVRGRHPLERPCEVKPCRVAPLLPGR
jgi:hypothetical protein